jgi:hypothetical protein
MKKLLRSDADYVYHLPQIRTACGQEVTSVIQ